MPRMLPDRPDLDQLRRQARELLRACRAGDPQARALIARHLPAAAQPTILAHAQAAIAREYGFVSWVRLRQHIAALPPKGRVELLADGLLAAARARDFEQLFARMAIPARDVNAVRDLLHRRGELERLVDALLAAAESPRDRLRFLAAQAMDHFADQRCEPALRRLLGDPVPRVRWAALHSIGCAACKIAPLTPGEDLVALTIDLALRDPSVKVRRVATYELGQACADPRATVTLEQIAAESTDQAILREARRALARL